MNPETESALERAYGLILDEAVQEALQEIVRRAQFRGYPFRVMRRDETEPLFALAPEGTDYPQLEVFPRQLNYIDEFDIGIRSTEDFPDDLLGGPLPLFGEPT